MIFALNYPVVRIRARIRVSVGIIFDLNYLVVRIRARVRPGQC